MLINDFFANRELLITGGTGFMGKALIEKLLRDCEKVKSLYVVLRSKKSLSVEQRLEQLKNDKVFNRIRKECPEVLNKLHAIQGDSQELGFGIQPDDLKLLKNVSVILHMAANVKFDNPLRSSILLNSRGTHELIKIAETLPNLVAFIHCSTAYCNPLEDVVEERVYDIPFDWRKTIKIAETYDEETLSILFCKYTGFYPNAYTFTKNISEQIVRDYSDKLPMLIFRPSVVFSALEEPVPGWLDNLNGPLATLAASSIGILPTVYCRPDITLDCVPVDIATKQIFIATYKRGMETLRKEHIPNGLEVINCCSGGLFDSNINSTTEAYRLAARKNPMENCIWYYDSPILTGCYYNFLLQQFIMSIPLAILIDTILFVTGRKPQVVILCRRIIYACKAVSFFTQKEYKMINDNMMALEDIVPQKEAYIYGSMHLLSLSNIAKYLEDTVLGVRHYIFDQPLEVTEAAKKRFKILFIASRTIKMLTASLIIYTFWTIVSKF